MKPYNQLLKESATRLLDNKEYTQEILGERSRAAYARKIELENEIRELLYMYR